MASPFFSGRIPQELYDRVDQHVKECGEGKTQILINALSQYLGVEISTPKSSNINTNLFLSELESLKERVGLLERSQSQQLLSDNKLITDDNSVMVLTSKEVTELTGIARRTFEDRHKSGKLPTSKNGYTILAHAGKQTEKPFANLWEVKADNS